MKSPTAIDYWWCSFMAKDLLLDDPDLLEGFRKGKPQALEAVWEYYFGLVHRVAREGIDKYPGLRSIPDLEDAIALVFDAAFGPDARRRYDGITPYSRFLVGIARNVVRRFILKQRRDPVWSPERGDDLQSVTENPEETVLNEEKRKVVADFPNLLNHLEKKVFQGYYKDGLSEERLAVVLGMTRYRVRKVLKQVEHRLQSHLKDLGLFD